MKLKMMTIAVGALLLLSAVVIFSIDPYSGESNSDNSKEERERERSNTMVAMVMGISSHLTVFQWVKQPR